MPAGQELLHFLKEDDKTVLVAQTTCKEGEEGSVLGQDGPTMVGSHLPVSARRFQAPIATRDAFPVCELLSVES